MQTLAASWFTSFRPFTTFHLVIVVVCMALTIGACRIGARTRGTQFERRFRIAWALAIVLTELVAYSWWLRPEHFSWGWTLPLHLCSIVVCIAPVALLMPWRTPQTLLYFWGLGLCSQGFLSPLRQDGLTAPPFWFFWLNHLEIVGSAVYLVVVFRFRPRPRDLAIAIGAGLAYVTGVASLDAYFGWNYAALGRDLHSTTSVVNFLGRWPWRVGVTAIVGCAVCALLWGVWELPRMWGGKPAQQPA